jgi:hypothetical protein
MFWRAKCGVERVGGDAPSAALATCLLPRLPHAVLVQVGPLVLTPPWARIGIGVEAQTGVRGDTVPSEAEFGERPAVAVHIEDGGQSGREGVPVGKVRDGRERQRVAVASDMRLGGKEQPVAIEPEAQRQRDPVRHLPRVRRVGGKRPDAGFRRRRRLEEEYGRRTTALQDMQDVAGISRHPRLLDEKAQRLTAESQVMAAGPIPREVADRAGELVPARPAVPLTVAAADHERVDVLEPWRRAARRPVRVPSELSCTQVDHHRVTEDGVPFAFPDPRRVVLIDR